MVAFDTNWDVDKYKNEFESSEHWALRRQFMVAHKHRYPELRLVCLTQVFFNMEFLGCKYPEKTMDLVNKLAGEVAEEFRESRKGKLKRTFVGAQDAAGAKAKGAKPPTGAVEGSESTDLPQGKKARVEKEEEIECIKKENCAEEDEEIECIEIKKNKKARVVKEEDVDFIEIKDEEEESCTATGSKDDYDEEQYVDAVKEVAKTIVAFIPTRTNSKTEKDPSIILSKTFHYKCMTFRVTGSKQEGWRCDFCVNPSNKPESKVMNKHGCTLLLASSSVYPKQGEAKAEAGQKAVDLLKKYCNYIEPNPEWFSEGGTPEFIEKRIPCNKSPRTYLIMKKEDTGHISPEVADLLLSNFQRSSNEDMFFPDEEYTEKEKINLMNRSQKHRMGFRHFGPGQMLKRHHVCVYKEKSAKEIFEEAEKMGGKHPKYLIHYKKC